MSDFEPRNSKSHIRNPKFAMPHEHLTSHDIAWLPVLLTGLIVAVLCSLLSVVVVLKRLAFIGQGISHAGFGGAGTAMVLGLAPGFTQDATILVFCLAAAALIGALSRRHKIEADSAIGIILVAAMAWGALMAGLAEHLQHFAWYRNLIGPSAEHVDFHAILFGSVLNVTAGDLLLAVAVAALVLVALIGLFKEMVFFAFDESAARVFGVRTGVIYYLLLGALSLVIVVAIRLTGFLLVSALLVIPGAVATLLSRRLAAVLTISMVVGVVGTLGGLGLSLTFHFLPAGPTMVATLCVLLIAAFALNRAMEATPRRG
jgi:ABC-type Mn2+/Zn2+ transport system permease subunit